LIRFAGDRFRATLHEISNIEFIEYFHEIVVRSQFMRRQSKLSLTFSPNLPGYDSRNGTGRVAGSAERYVVDHGTASQSTFKSPNVEKHR
jgi:hypothetical protein